MKEEFIKFLNKTKAHDKFLVNLVKRGRDFHNLIQEVSPEIYIMSAFSWCNTPEKEIYWDNLDVRWKEIVRKHGKENKQTSN